MIHNPARYATMPIGVVVRRSPGVTRWARWAWTASGVLPGAGPATWSELRHDGDVTEFHAGTVTLELHGSDTESYLQGLSAQVPCVYVVLRDTDCADRPLEVVLVTASPYEAQDYADNGEDLVEKIAMPEGLVAWVRDFVQAHHEEEVFVKRRRDREDLSRVEDGVGDARVVQMADVYRAPASRRKERLQ